VKTYRLAVLLSITLHNTPALMAGSYAPSHLLEPISDVVMLAIFLLNTRKWIKQAMESVQSCLRFTKGAPTTSWSSGITPSRSLCSSAVPLSSIRLKYVNPKPSQKINLNNKENHSNMPIQYVCFDNYFLCPVINGQAYLRCGAACYNNFEYTYATL